MQETELIKRAQDGDGEAFNALIGKYEKRIYNTAYKFMRNEYDAQDAAQDAIIKLYSNLRKFSFNSAFSTWMYRVTANTCLDMLRRRKPETGIEEFERMALSADGNPAEETVNRELGESIKNAIRKLPEKYIPVIVLKDMEGLKYEEIADALHISVGTVKSRISRAREKLRDILVADKVI